MTEKKAEDTIIMLTNVRIAFPQIFEAAQVNGEGKPAFSAAFLLPLDHPDIPKIKAAIAKTAQDKWGAKTAEILPALVAADKVCLHNGDLKSDLEGYAGNLFISSRSPGRPLVINADRTPLTAADGKPYSGCFVNAQISLWAMQNKYGKRINAQLRGVQFVADGEAFSGGGVASPDEFDAVENDVDGAAPTVTPGGAEDYGDLLG